MYIRGEPKQISTCMTTSFPFQLVPIPTSQYKCNKGCCTRSFCPLTLAYARTIHKFQGLSAGPVDKGKIPNMYDCIVCDPDKNEIEGRALGLLYTAVSRATTFGDDDGLNSALYFTGQSFKAERLRGLGIKKDSRDEYQNVVRRRIWVEFLKTNITRGSVSSQEQEALALWSVSHRVSYDCLYNRTKLYVNSRTRQKKPPQRDSSRNNSQRGHRKRKRHANQS